MSGDPIYPAEALAAFAAVLIGAAGLEQDKAATVAEVLLEAICSAKPPMAWRSRRPVGARSRTAA
jgi:hypothetical protein